METNQEQNTPFNGKCHDFRLSKGVCRRRRTGKENTITTDLEPKTLKNMEMIGKNSRKPIYIFIYIYYIVLGSLGGRLPAKTL